MSAAEKLGALDEAIRAPDVDDMDSIHTLASKDAVIAALSQIVAVVEAAEKRRPDGTFYAQEIAAALAVLDEKLGDVT